MIKTVLFTILANGILISRIFAQSPIITSENNWAIGDKQVILTADSTGIEPGVSGINVNWDFSGLQVDNTVDSAISTFADPKSTSYSSSFPKANLVEIDSSGNNYNFYNYGSAQVEELGVASYDTATQTSTKVPFSNTLILYTYPVTYGYTHTDTYAANANVSFFNIFIKGGIVLNVDGYGTMKIRNQTYNNVLRIKTVNISKDSVDLGFLGQSVVYDTSLSFIYVTPGKKSPILTISYDIQQQDTSMPSRSKTVTFNDFDHVHTSGIAVANQDEIAMNAYPNPSDGNFSLVYISNSQSKADIAITDQLGRVVALRKNCQMHPGKNILDWSERNLMKGFYTVTLINGDHVIAQKLVIR